MYQYIIHLLILISIYAILGLSLNLIMGFTGLVSAAQAAFFGLGAYATAILTTEYHLNFFVSVAIGLVVSLLVALLSGLVFSRFKGDFYVLGTLGFNMIAFALMLNLEAFTGGPLGISGIPRPYMFGLNMYDNFNFLILAIIFLFLVFLVCQFIINSAFGRVLKGIREDEQALSVFGYKTSNFKLLIFVIGSMMAAIAGSLFASYITYIDPNNFTLNNSVFIIAVIILGGLANLRGSLLGAVFLILLPQLLRFVGFPDDVASQMRQVVYGVLIILLMIYRPQGLMGEYKL